MGKHLMVCVLSLLSSACGMEVKNSRKSPRNKMLSQTWPPLRGEKVQERTISVPRAYKQDAVFNLMRAVFNPNLFQEFYELLKQTNITSEAINNPIETPIFFTIKFFHAKLRSREKWLYAKEATLLELFIDGKKVEYIGNPFIAEVRPFLSKQEKYYLDQLIALGAYDTEFSSMLPAVVQEECFSQDLQGLENLKPNARVRAVHRILSELHQYKRDREIVIDDWLEMEVDQIEKPIHLDYLIQEINKEIGYLMTCFPNTALVELEEEDKRVCEEFIQELLETSEQSMEYKTLRDWAPELVLKTLKKLVMKNPNSPFYNENIDKEQFRLWNILQFLKFDLS
jgi:hypothetical protein